MGSRPVRIGNAADVIENGWSEQRHAYTTAYGSTDIDAAIALADSTANGS